MHCVTLIDQGSLKLEKMLSVACGSLARAAIGRAYGLNLYWRRFFPTTRSALC